MNKYIHPSLPCTTCHNPTTGREKQILQNLRNICEMYERNNKVQDYLQGKHLRLNFSIHNRCKYGLPCDKLRIYDNECKNIADKLNNTLIAIAITHDESYHDCYNLCRGQFPAVCKQLEVLYYNRAV